MEYVSKVLFWISNGLMAPVVVGLLYFFLRSILMLGGFFSRYLQRRRTTEKLDAALDALDAETLPLLPDRLSDCPTDDFTRAARTLIGLRSKARTERVLSSFEVTADAELGKYKMLVKFGPILGLMGTLIPMGPALAGLATGDVASMAYNMQIAFATTVIGLFVGAVGFVLLQVRQRWFVADLSTLEYIAGIIDESSHTATTPKNTAP